jgi:hypothetical protein
MSYRAIDMRDANIVGAAPVAACGDAPRSRRMRGRVGAIDAPPAPLQTSISRS